MKGLPLAYNKDMQEDKEALFDVVDTVNACLGVTTTVLANLRVNEESGREGYLLRTYGMDQCSLPDLAIYIKDRTQPDTAYHILLNVGLYLVQGRPSLQVGIGDRVEFRDRTYLLTDPGYSTPEFASQNGLLLLVEVWINKKPLPSG